MSRRLLTPWVLIASLLFGLWTAAGHDAGHVRATAHPEVCAVCAFAGGIGAGLASVLVALVLAALGSVVAMPATPAQRLARCAPVRVRGPPIVLA